jgi:DNA polymerase III delta prime subunit
MAHHAYFIVGDIEEGIAQALGFVGEELGMETLANPDVMTIRHGLLSVDDARKLRSLAELSPTQSDKKVLIISASRLFHEAQNALLKLFEEPPAGTILILVIPAEGMLLPTLRSRLIELGAPKASPSASSTLSSSHSHLSHEATEFLNANSAAREKLIAKLLDRAKSDKDEEKQAARLSAIRLLEGLTKDAYEKWLAEKDPKKRESFELLLEDLNAFLPILHERSAPLKLIFEHLLLVA